MILVSLLGTHDSSIFPILFEFKDKIKKHIIIHDDSKYEKAINRKFFLSQEKFKNFYSLSYQNLSIQIDEDNYDSIISCLKKIEIYCDGNFENLYFNATDGLVSSTIILSDRLLDKNAKFIAYDIFDNGYNLVSKTSMEKKKIENNIDIKTHFILKGYNISSQGNKFEAFQRKDVVMQLCENLDNFQEFANEIQHKNANQIEGFKNIKQKLQSIGKLDDKMFIQGGIFEEYIFWLVEDNFHFDQVMFNVKVEFAENVSNEFDVLMIKDNHLHAIECKLRKSVSGEDYVYKLDSVVDYLDDDGKGMILVIGGENKRYTNNGNPKTSFSLGTKERAKHAEILIHHSKTFDKSKFLEDIKNHFLS